MKQYNIEEYNRLCAEFLGWEHKGTHLEAEYYKTPLWGGSDIALHQMEFHSDWQWIFEFIKEIESKGYWVEIYGQNHPWEERRIHVTSIKSGMVPVFRGEADDWKESIILAIWHFLTSHNGKPHYEQPAIKETTQLPGIDPCQVIPSDPMTVKETTV